MTWSGKRPSVFGREVSATSKRIFVRSAQMVFASIVYGSILTSAPGQPVDLGILRASWILAFEESGLAIISTNIVYAPGIEDGIGPHGRIKLRSSVGGFQSVKLTVAGYRRIVAAAIAEEKAVRLA